MIEWDAILKKSSAVASALPKQYYPSYFELIHHPVKAGHTTQKLYITAGLNQLYATQAKSVINALADEAVALFELDADIRDEYHKLLDGK